LSGVLLLRPYLRTDKELKVGQYFKRRITRIYTPYFFAVIFAGLVIAVNTIWPTWYSAILLKFNWTEWLSQFFLFNFNGAYYNLAWWSLQLEVIFYLSIPFLIPVFRLSKFLPTIMIVMALSLCAQFAAAYFLPSLYSTTQLYLSPVLFVDYMMCFTLGCFLAKQSFEVNTAYWSFGLGLILSISSVWYFPLLHSGFAFIYFAFYILIEHNSFSLQKRLSGPLLVWLGERSYSLFLTHFSVLYLVNYLTSYIVEDRSILYAVITRSGGILVSFFVAMVLFYFVERKQARGLQTADQFWPPIYPFVK
jgi:peptidoglycan/LPS O-acetylase OafA/YrhL